MLDTGKYNHLFVDLSMPSCNADIHRLREDLHKLRDLKEFFEDAGADLIVKIGPNEPDSSNEFFALGVRLCEKSVNYNKVFWIEIKDYQAYWIAPKHDGEALVLRKLVSALYSIPLESH